MYWFNNSSLQWYILFLVVQVKSAFTRTYNKEQHKTPYVLKGPIPKSRGKGSSEQLGLEEEQEEEDEEDDNLENNAMIVKNKKPPAKNKKAKNEPTKGKGKGKGKASKS